MALNRIHVNAPPARVFEVLSRPDNYGHWVVGSKHIRDADPGWPAIGSKFHHTVGFGPVTLRDNTEVEDVERQRRLVLRAKTRPLGAARVRLYLDADSGGTRVTMEENPVGVPAQVTAPLVDLVIRRRNDESLRRLKELAEDRSRG